MTNDDERRRLIRAAVEEHTPNTKQALDIVLSDEKVMKAISMAMEGCPETAAEAMLSRFSLVAVSAFLSGCSHGADTLAACIKTIKGDHNGPSA